MATSRHRHRHTYKIVLLGDQYCGKTSIIRRFVSGRYDPNYIQTRAGEVFKKEVTVNGSTFLVHIFDTAGQNSLKSVIRSLYRYAHGILLVYDITRRKTLSDITAWLSLIEANCAHSPEVLILGNKIDLPEDSRDVTQKEGDETAAKHNIPFIEVSAKRNEHIEEAFHTLVKQVLDKRKAEDLLLLQNGTVHLQDQQPQIKCCF